MVSNPQVQPMLLMPERGHHHHNVHSGAGLIANNHSNLATIITAGNANINNNGVALNKAATGGAVSSGTAANNGGNSTTYSTLVRLTAWGVPALQTVAVLVARFVDADELLGEKDTTIWEEQSSENNNMADYVDRKMAAKMSNDWLIWLNL